MLSATSWSWKLYLITIKSPPTNTSRSHYLRSINHLSLRYTVTSTRITNKSSSLSIDSKSNVNENQSSQTFIGFTKYRLQKNPTKSLAALMMKLYNVISLWWDQNKVILDHALLVKVIRTSRNIKQSEKNVECEWKLRLWRHFRKIFSQSYS